MEEPTFLSPHVQRLHWSAGSWHVRGRAFARTDQRQGRTLHQTQQPTGRTNQSRSRDQEH
ncbi:MAG: hypothetical protein RMX89_02770 [Nostoc sp. DedSLP04]|nr:hypothetical protein [Nostoc sp. DedSLP04]MDZ8030012.1 hypothetical protein [Nostoc sp. DedSLP04]